LESRIKVTVQPNSVIGASVGWVESSKTHHPPSSSGGGSSKTRPTLQLRRSALHSAEWLQIKVPRPPSRAHSTPTRPRFHRSGGVRTGPFPCRVIRSRRAGLGLPHGPEAGRGRSDLPSRPPSCRAPPRRAPV